jgi:IclR family transcriptional regulator, KDG regulon repressor
MPVQSLTRAFDIVGLLAQEQQGFSLSVIAEQLDLPTSTVYRLLSALKERGYVEQTKKSGVYRLGLTFVEISSLYLNRLELKTEAEPVLRELSMLTGQTAFLAIRDEWQIVYMEKMEQFSSLRKYSIIGQRKPVYATSLGKALLLGLEDAEIEAILRDVKFEKFGPKTHSDLPRLLFDIQSSRERGWALDDEEAEEDVRCVAAPIYDYRSRPIAAVSVSWAISAFPDMEIGKTASHVMHAALEISRHMGYQQPEQ